MENLTDRIDIGEDTIDRSLEELTADAVVKKWITQVRLTPDSAEYDVEIDRPAERQDEFMLTKPA